MKPLASLSGWIFIALGGVGVWWSRSPRYFLVPYANDRLPSSTSLSTHSDLFGAGHELILSVALIFAGALILALSSKLPKSLDRPGASAEELRDPRSHSDGA